MNITKKGLLSAEFLPFFTTYLERKISAKVQKSNVLIFDVVPTDLSKYNPYGLTYYYGRLETAVALIEHTLATVLSVSRALKIEPIEVALKPKKAQSSTHDQRYWQKIKLFQKEYKNFVVLPSNQDFFSLFNPKTLVINRPFTSTAHLATLCGSPAVYYDPHCEICGTHQPRFQD